MRLFKLAIFTLIIIFLILTVIGSLFPSNIVVTRATSISQNSDSIKKYIDNYDEWNNWMEGAKNSDYKVISKDSTHAYFGTVIITLLSKKNNTWQHEWKSKTFTQNSTFQITPSNAENCTVQWQFTQHVSWYPWAKIGSIMTDKIIGTSLEKSLSNLKSLAEKIQ
jgi:hypothetical protein